jgi:hypothetical protein
VRHDWVPLEWHETAGRANSMLPRVRVCRPCHRDLSRQQLDCGIDLTHQGARTPNDRVWALYSGFFEHGAAMLAQHWLAFVRALAEPYERMGRAATATIEQTTDVVRHPGPDPVANDRRATYRRRPKPRAARERRDPADADAAEGVRGLAVLVLLGQLAHALFGEPRRGVNAQVQHVVDHKAEVAAGLEALHGTSEGQAVLDSLLEGVARMDQAARGLLRAQTPDELGAALLEAKDLLTRGNDVLAFLSGLIE